MKHPNRLIMALVCAATTAWLPLQAQAQSGAAAGTAGASKMGSGSMSANTSDGLAAPAGNSGVGTSGNSGSGSSSSTGSTGNSAAGASSSMPASQGSSADAGSSGNSTGKSTGSVNAGASIGKGDANLMRELAFANVSEIAAAKIALQKGKSAEVKGYAQHMIDDHTKATTELQTLAQSKNVKLPTEPDPQHKSAAKTLSALSGDTFDKAYMRQAGVTDHKNTLNLLQRISKNAKDPELKAMADKLMPTVTGHLESVQAMSGKKDTADASSATGGAGNSVGGARKPASSSGQ